jgi:hypothetical protein
VQAEVQALLQERPSGGATLAARRQRLEPLQQPTTTGRHLQISTAAFSAPVVKNPSSNKYYYGPKERAIFMKHAHSDDDLVL